ncbi:hypothetical protein SOCE26_101630 [Sorangium cellulosum]|uniref:Uncharacterized protein n=1 Tax=Sorangium cellulosum TaxID=56 RepID=A0A2L0FAN6_SORCE|nr:hypothetical protein [Sorangium cellulosum]AUX48624.1 hypothetical protein SOCE26_101630 [Sorangium cellulosum]
MEGEVETAQDGGARAKGNDTLGRLDAAEITRAIAAFSRENPHVAIAAAAGLGFLLGGGLTPRVLSKLGALATRSYVKGTLVQAVQALLQELPQTEEGQLGSTP